MLNLFIFHGGAAFLSEGTKLFAIKGLNKTEYVATENRDAINGYKVFSLGDKERVGSWLFHDLKQDQTRKIEIFRGHGAGEKIASYEGKDVSAILNLPIQAGPTKITNQHRRKVIRLRINLYFTTTARLLNVT